MGVTTEQAVEPKMSPTERSKRRKWVIGTLLLLLSITVAVVLLLVLMLVKPDNSSTNEAPPTEPPTMMENFTIISAANSSEVVTIPNPPEPSFEDESTNCPHKQGDLKLWHDPSTWPLGEVPTAGDIILPDNTKVLVDQSIRNDQHIITIPSSSSLIFGSVAGEEGIEMHVKGLVVEGSLIAGSDSCRLQTPVSITLHGTRPMENIQDLPEFYKGIAVNGGTLSLHGKRYYRTWTRLARTAMPGHLELWLQHEVNWEPGQQVVLVTTAVKDTREWHQNEVLEIESVLVETLDMDGVAAVVKLKDPVQYKHVANSNYQAEVGLLSRSITIQGAPEDSPPTDPDPLNCVVPDRFGDDTAPCPDKRLTGFGGHVMVYNTGAKAFVEGVELFRMGQTNVLRRYPMHFHILGNACTDCYVRDSSIHESYYRCVAIHGTNGVEVSENVAYDVTGYCYYLEDGVEENNTLSFNLAAHIHVIGTPASGYGGSQEIPLFYESENLTLPADVTASGFYITNMHNTLVGNAASGGWAGFAFPVLYAPIGDHRDVNMRPASRPSLQMDGNSAHSSGWWWRHAGAFYSGGALFYDGDRLVYNAGRDKSHNRYPCHKDMCAMGNCSSPCEGPDRAWNRLTNTKTYLQPSSGLNAWSGRLDVVGFEAHDVALGLELIEAGIWISDLLVVCRTGEEWALPEDAHSNQVSGNGFFWYDTAQEHIMTNATFRNCGYRSDEYNHYDTSPTRGCTGKEDGNDFNGCTDSSTVFGLLSTSDWFTPEIMQATKDISFEDCGRRFMLTEVSMTKTTSVSARGQNWLDVDGSVSGLNQPTMIGSGVWDSGLWWMVDRNVVEDPQGPLVFIKKSRRTRGLGHIRVEWDLSIHSQVGVNFCGNGNGLPCPALGRVRHFGPMFGPGADKLGGLAITANPEIVGPVGGFGWLLSFNGGAPHTLKIDTVEVDPETPLVIGIVYPPKTNFNITAHAAPSCIPTAQYSCQVPFTQVDTAAQVRKSDGNVYHFDQTNGLLTLRIIQPPTDFTGNPSWQFWDWNTPGRDGQGFAVDRFTRQNITLPMFSRGAFLKIRADCPRWQAFCAEKLTDFKPPACSPGFTQTAYDQCCNAAGICEHA